MNVRYVAPFTEGTRGREPRGTSSPMAPYPPPVQSHRIATSDLIFVRYTNIGISVSSLELYVVAVVASLILKTDCSPVHQQ
jgi:hypothetical protein